MKVGINGMGRIGRLALRSAFGGIRRPDSDPRGDNRLDVVHINEVKGGIAATAHLLEFDSVHGRWHETIGVETDSVGRNRKSRASASASTQRLATSRGAISVATSCWNAPASS